MANERFIGLDELIANAITIIPDADDSDRNIFRTWVYNCISDIGIVFTHIEQEEIWPEDLSLRKPDKLISTRKLALYNAGHEELVYTFQGQGAGRVHTGKEQTGVRSIDVSEDEYYFHLGSNGSEVNYAIIEFYKIPLNPAGDIEVPYYFVEAINHYIRWYWSLRQNENQSAIKENKQTYKEARGMVKAKNRAPSQLQGKAIFKDWMSMITRVQYNRF